MIFSISRELISDIPGFLTVVDATFGRQSQHTKSSEASKLEYDPPILEQDLFRSQQEQITMHLHVPFEDAGGKFNSPDMQHLLQCIPESCHNRTDVFFKIVDNSMSYLTFQGKRQHWDIVIQPMRAFKLSKDECWVVPVGYPMACNWYKLHFDDAMNVMVWETSGVGATFLPHKSLLPG